MGDQTQYPLQIDEGGTACEDDLGQDVAASWVGDLYVARVYEQQFEGQTAGNEGESSITLEGRGHPDVLFTQLIEPFEDAHAIPQSTLYPGVDILQDIS